MITDRKLSVSTVVNCVLFSELLFRGGYKRFKDFVRNVAYWKFYG